jgi:hypothetical protein
MTGTEVSTFYQQLNNQAKKKKKLTCSGSPLTTSRYAKKELQKIKSIAHIKFLSSIVF